MKLTCRPTQPWRVSPHPDALDPTTQPWRVPLTQILETAMIARHTKALGPSWTVLLSGGSSKGPGFRDYTAWPRV